MPSLSEQTKVFTATSCALSRLCLDDKRRVPIVNLPVAVSSHPGGDGSGGATPSGGPCAKEEAIKDIAARMLEVRIVKSRG